MKLFSGGKDISELVESISWSGDAKQVARKINFTIAKSSKDDALPKVVIHEGDEVTMRNDLNENIFTGIIFDIDKTATSNTVAYLAFDLMFYVHHSDVSNVYEGLPENITKEIAAELGIECGEIAVTGISVYMPCLGKTAYEGIMTAYTAASRTNGKRYIPLMQKANKLCVVEKGTQCGVVLGRNDGLTDANYKSSLQSLVNKVIITDKNGNAVNIIEDRDSQNKYGTVQKVYKQEDGKDATSEAKNLLKTTEQSASIHGIPNDFRAVSGYSLIIQEADTGLYGTFYIESDTHTFTNGKAEMQLSLSFENMMDEFEIEKVEVNDE